MKTAALEECSIKESKQRGTTANERTKIKEVVVLVGVFCS